MIQSVVMTLEADLVTAQQANQDLIAESERLAVALQREQSTVETLQADKAELSGRLGQLTKDLEEVRAEAAAQREAAEHARTEKAKLDLRLEGVPRLETEIERLKTVLELERNAKVVAEQQAAVSQARLEKTEAQLKELVANNAVPRLDAELGKLKTSLDQGIRPANPSTSNEQLQAPSCPRKPSCTPCLKRSPIRATLSPARAGSTARNSRLN